MPNNSRAVIAQAKQVETVTRTATRRALNAMARQATTLTLRLLAEEMGLTQTKLRPYVRSINANYSTLSSAVRVTPHTYNIASFPGVRQTKVGKTVFTYSRKGKTRSVKAKGGGVWSNAWGHSKFYRGGFLIQGKKTAMRRVGKARYPIRPLYGPRIHREFVQPQVEEALTSLVSEKLPDVMQHEIAFALRGAGIR